MFDTGQIAAVTDAFGLGVPCDISGPVARGEQGQIFRLETVTGTWAVKEQFGDSGERGVQEAAAFQQAARVAGVRAPGIVKDPAGRILRELAGAWVRIYEWVDLREPDQFLDPEQLGQILARLHQTEFTGTAPVDPWYSDPVGAVRWGEIEQELTAAGAPFAADFASLRADFVAMEEFLTPPERLRTCHRDLFADNLRATTAGELCVIDWDDCGLADPTQELCFVLVEFGGDEGRGLSGGPAEAPRRAQALYRAYVAAGGPGRITGPGDFSMVIAQLGHLNARAATRWLTAAPGDPERRRMADLLAEPVAAPLTCKLIDRLVEATSKITDRW